MPEQLNEQMDQVRETASQLAASLPVWLDVGLAMLGLWGVFLWLFGRRLVRPTLAMLGLLSGGLTAGLIARQYADGATLAGWALGGGIAGGLFIWITFRIWIALALAVVLGAATPWAVLAWEGAPWPVEAGQSIRDAAGEAIDEGRERLGEHLPGGAGAEEETEAADGDGGSSGEGEGEEEREGVLAKLAALGGEVWGDLSRWWTEELDGAVRWSIVAGAAIVAVGGLIVGLILPNLGSSLAAALVGSVLVGGVVLRLTGRYLESVHDWLPSSPRGALIALVAATVIGTMIQWTLTGRRADS